MYGSGLQLDNASPLVSDNIFYANSNLDVLLDIDKLKRVINNDSLKVGLTSGTMTTSDTLLSNNYYYRLLNSLVVPSGRTLIISPGAVVQFPATTAANK